MSRRSKKQAKFGNPLWQGLTFGVLSFILAVLILFPSRLITEQLHFLGALLTIIVIVAVGVLADVIGVAAAAANESPFNAMAARRVAGAKHAIRLVRNADRVSAICADVVGDIAGTISGAAGAALVIRLATMIPDLSAHQTALHTGVVALVASLTVGGKAGSKSLALTRWIGILFFAGKVLWWLETYLHIRVLRNSGKRQGRPS